jgi:predicted dehydrogenase
LRLGIVGTGFIGQLHLRNAVESDEVDVITIAGARGTASGAQATRDLVASSRTPRVRTVQELLADADAEAVLLATRTSEHAQQAVDVLRRGKHQRKFDRPDRKRQ